MLANGASSTAVGRYQFIQSTLGKTAQQLGMDPTTTKMTPEVQDQLASHLLKQRGAEKFLNGQMGEREFRGQLSREWASIGDPEKKKNHTSRAPMASTATITNTRSGAVSRSGSPG